MKEKDAAALMIGTSDFPLLFSSIALAESYLEGIDVENGEYSYALSPDGVSYDLISDGANGVIILERRDVDVSPDEFRTRLVSFLNEVGVLVDEHASTVELLRLSKPWVDDGL